MTTVLLLVIVFDVGFVAGCGWAAIAEASRREPGITPDVSAGPLPMSGVGGRTPEPENGNTGLAS